MTTPQDVVREIVAAADALDLPELLTVAGEIGAIISRKSTEANEVAGARAAGELAVDELEKKETGG